MTCLSHVYYLEEMKSLQQGLVQANLSSRQSNNTKNDNSFKKLLISITIKIMVADLDEDEFGVAILTRPNKINERFVICFVTRT